MLQKAQMVVQALRLGSSNRASLLFHGSIDKFASMWGNIHHFQDVISNYHMHLILTVHVHFMLSDENAKVVVYVSMAVPKHGNGAWLHAFHRCLGLR